MSGPWSSFFLIIFIIPGENIPAPRPGSGSDSGSVPWPKCVCSTRPQASRVLKASPSTTSLVSSSGPTPCATPWRFPNWTAASAEFCSTRTWSTPDPSSPTQRTGEWLNVRSVVVEPKQRLRFGLTGSVTAGGCTGRTGTETGRRSRWPTWTGRSGWFWWKTTWDFPTGWPSTPTTSSCAGPTQVRRTWQEAEPDVWSAGQNCSGRLQSRRIDWWIDWLTDWWVCRYS